MKTTKKTGWLCGIVFAAICFASCETEEKQTYYCVLNEESITLRVGDKPYQLKATVMSDNEEEDTEFDRSVQWASQDETIATVDDYGRVQAISPGTVTVIATPSIGGKEAGCTVTVKKQPVYAWVRTKIVDWPGKSEESWVQTCKITRTVHTEKKIDKDDPNKITIAFTAQRNTCGTPGYTMKGSATNILPEIIRENQRLDFTFYVYLNRGKGTSNSGEAMFDVPDLDPHYVTAGRVRFKDKTGETRPGVRFVETGEGTFTVSLEKMFKGGKDGDMISLYWRLAEYQLEAQYKWTMINDD